MVDVPAQPAVPSALSTARYLQAILSDLIKMAETARLESTEAMLLAAKIELNGAVRVMNAEWEQQAAGGTFPTKLEVQSDNR